MRFIVPFFAVMATTASAAPIGLSYIGGTTVPNDTQIDGAAFGGISALAQSGTGTYYALSDVGGEDGTPPRLYEMRITADESGIQTPEIVRQILLTDTDGSALPTTGKTVDLEALRVAANGNLYIASEGTEGATPETTYQPWLREYRPDGTYVRDLPTPDIYDYTPGDNTTGPRNNAVFESLAISVDGTLVVANERSLFQDGGYANADDGIPVRVTRIDPNTPSGGASYAYDLPPRVADYSTGEAFLTEMLALPGGGFIGLERGWSSKSGFTGTLTYMAVEDQTTDISTLPGLIGATYTPMLREELLTLSGDYAGAPLDNIEGLAFGPTLANGNSTLIVATDNNFRETQTTQFLLFEVTPATPVPVPGSFPLLLGALGVLALRRR